MPNMTSCQSRKRKASEDATCGESKRVRVCLRSVIKELRHQRVDQDRLVFFDKKVSYKGGSADVMRATLFGAKPIDMDNLDWENANEVAVKKFRPGDDSNKRAQSASFTNELSLLSELRHSNIINFLGFVHNPSGGISWIVFPWMGNGNLREFVQIQKWSIPERLSLIYDVTCGVHYLHSRNPPIRHGDLKSLNILINGECHAFITDFGSARKLESHLDREDSNTVNSPVLPTRSTDNAPDRDRASPLATVGECETLMTLRGPAHTLRWAAPEMLEEDAFSLSLASDIWAVGWICWEIMTGTIPFDDLRKDTAIFLRVTQGALPKVENDAEISQVRALCAMMNRCWALSPQGRPTARECEKNMSWENRKVPERTYAITTSRWTAEQMCYLGYTVISNEKIGDGTRHLSRAFDLTNPHRDPAMRAAAAIGLGNACTTRGEYTKAEEWCKEARGIYEKLQHEQGIANATLRLGDIYRLQDQFGQAETSYTKAQEICARIGDRLGDARATWGLGTVYCLKNDFIRAEATYERARETYTRIEYPRGVADSSWGLGEVCRLQDQYDKAEASYRQAHERYGLIGDRRGAANAAWGMGTVYCLRSKYAEAKIWCNEARSIFTRIQLDLGVVGAARRLGDIYRFEGEYRKAEESYTEAQKLSTRIGDVRGVAGATWGLGETYCLLNEYSKAEASYTRARELYAQIGDQRGDADSLYSLYRLRWQQHRYNDAESCLREATSVYRAVGAGKEAQSCVTQLQSLRGRLVPAAWKSGV